ncbi:hypothetical protein [Streptomyces sp. NRRL B-3229]|uniref:hypothetical protein n=1 Tax=Streptomyces sp. NRRL B-3229 TaxID=1463836 RepID=UPI0004BEC276|nr:hypothetical protein [Streptomyces sp. NRRL B-3229]
MMNDVTLPGLPVQLIQCPFCDRFPTPEDVYPRGATDRWEKLLKNADQNAINDYLVKDRAFFEHDLVDGGRCPAEILPGPAFNGISRGQALTKAAELMRILGLS